MAKVNTKFISAKTQTKMAKVFKELDREPKKFDMWTWGIAVNKDTLLQLLASDELVYSDIEDEIKRLAKINPPCGTVDCLAGQTLVTLGGFKPNLKIGKRGYYEFPDNTPEKALKLLGLSEDQAALLFYPDNWPYKFEQALDKLESGTKEYLAVAKKRWQHMIETGE
jgi:hypothetical protein